MRPSNDGNFVIFGYQSEVEIKDQWNDVNVWCRGLIFDAHTKQHVAIPFKKFWNVGQKPHTREDALASLGHPVQVAEKLDGSLGILFWDHYAQRLRVSTRGSLESEQAQWATQWVNELPETQRNTLRNAILDPVIPITYMTEIIYPANRIVVQYDFAGLVFLDGVMSDGTTLSMRNYLPYVPPEMRVAETYAPTSVTELLSRAKGLPGMEEGYVVTYACGLKAKIKGDEYIRLHRIRFDLTSRRVYELLSKFDPDVAGCGIWEVVDRMLTAVPDEFADPVRKCADTLLTRYTDVWDNVTWHRETAELESRGERKKMALYAQKHLPPSQLGTFFAQLDGDRKKAERLAWKAVEYRDLAI